MSKFIIHHEMKMIHHSSFVCDECHIPSYAHQLREDTVDEEYMLSLLEKSYETCPNCMDHSSSIVQKVKSTQIV